MRINPCHGCRFKSGCGIYEGFRKSAAGTGARSITFRCERVQKMLPPGTRVMLPMAYRDEDGNGWGPQVVRTTMPATVLRTYDDARFHAVMDKDELIEEDRFRWRKKMHIRRIAGILDDPPVAICKNGNPQIEGECQFRQDGSCFCAEQDVLAAMS